MGTSPRCSSASLSNACGLRSICPGAPGDAAADAVPAGDGDAAAGGTLAEVLATGPAAACPARAGAPHPATTPRTAADTALTNARRHRRRGYSWGISVFSFNHADR